MPALTIPERYRKGVAQIGTLSDASFQDLFVALSKSSAANTVRDLAKKIEGDAPSIPSEVRESIITAVSSMQSLQKSAHVDAEKLSSDVWAAMHEDSPELVEGVEAETLKSRLSVLLQKTVLHLKNVKVAELRSEVERSFCGARILTDVRTAFQEDTSKHPAMTILHTLEIKYHDDTAQHREFYVALDDNDLMILKEAIERAEKKKSTLVELLNKAGFEMFD